MEEVLVLLILGGVLVWVVVSTGLWMWLLILCAPLLLAWMR